MSRYSRSPRLRRPRTPGTMDVIGGRQHNLTKAEHPPFLFVVDELAPYLSHGVRAVTSNTATAAPIDQSTNVSDTIVTRSCGTSTPPGPAQCRIRVHAPLRRRVRCRIRGVRDHRVESFQTGVRPRQKCAASRLRGNILHARTQAIP